MSLFSQEQIQSLAPDAASLKAGKELATVRKWPALAHNDRVLWGEAQGSGKDPYRTQVDLTSVAFNCSCPSRKFPCKHGLGLLLLYIGEPSAFTSPDEPAWVSEWMNKRVEKGAKVARQTPVAAEKAPKTDTDRKAGTQQKRTADRLDTVRAGVAELDRWLEDLVRTGLLSLPEKGSAFWQKTAARMVDAKAPGLANRVKQLGNLPYFDGNAWQSDALRQCGQLHLLTRAFDRLDQLPPDLQDDVRSAIGLTINQKDLMESPSAETLTDLYWVLARQTTVEDDLTIQRNYLYGQTSGRFALILNFAYKNTPIQTLLVPGTQTDAMLVFYPGRHPYRAVLKGQRSGTDAQIRASLPAVNVCADWLSAQQALADVLSQSPWSDEVPQVIASLSLATDAGRHYLSDRSGLSQPVDPHWAAASYYRFLALSGGQPVTVFGLRSERYVLPLGLWLNEAYHCL